MKVAILGAGAGGAAAAVELGQRGLETALWNRSETTLDAFRRQGGIAYEGVLGSGTACPGLMTTDLARAVDGADVILVCLPTLAHAALAGALADLDAPDRRPLVLNPGHTGGALEVTTVFERRGVTPPPVAELSTLTYVARINNAARLRVSGAAQQVRAAALPGGEPALAAATELYPAARRESDVLVSGLSNVNMVLHPPGAVCAAAWVEASGGDFTFYVDGLSDGVGRVMEALDTERIAVGAAYGHDLPSLFEEMQAIGTIERSATAAAGLAAAVRGGEANRRIKAPDSLSHRYYREDFWYGLQPFLVFAEIAGIDVPVARSLMALGRCLAPAPPAAGGRSAAAMGIESMNQAALLQRIRG